MKFSGEKQSKVALSASGRGRSMWRRRGQLASGGRELSSEDGRDEEVLPEQLVGVEVSGSRPKGPIGDRRVVR